MTKETEQTETLNYLDNETLRAEACTLKGRYYFVNMRTFQSEIACWAAFQREHKRRYGCGASFKEVGNIRERLRHMYLAYGFLRGRKFSDMIAYAHPGQDITHEVGFGIVMARVKHYIDDNSPSLWGPGTYHVSWKQRREILEAEKARIEADWAAWVEDAKATAATFPKIHRERVDARHARYTARRKAREAEQAQAEQAQAETEAAEVPEEIEVGV